MQPSDRKAFSDALTHLFAIYGDDVTKKMLDAWWGVLSPYQLNAVLAAMNLHAGDVERGMFRPTPADMRKHLEITIPGLMRARRDAIAADARERIAPLRERIDRLHADVRLRLLKEADARVLIAPIEQHIRAILAEPAVVLALAPQADLRDREAEIAPSDRLPAAVRKALGWLGKPKPK